jgi:dTDP-4-dehydrorhamnose reductase
MKILVLGFKGQLGQCCYDQLENTDHDVIYTSRDQIDVADFDQTSRQILKIVPDVVINATAYTAVDKAENNREKAEEINHLAVENIANVCALLGNWLIHFSTDYVFDGQSKLPYKEGDSTNPQGVYGVTKLNGELAIRSSGCKFLIIRTAWIFSEYGNNFLRTMLRLGSESDKLHIVSDQVGCPTYAQDIARSIVKIIPQLKLKKEGGLYHYCGEQSCSWHEFALAIFEKAKACNLKIPRTINPIETSAYPTPAKRPAFSVLECSKIESDFGVTRSNWMDGIQRVLDVFDPQKAVR